jgi:hypothetical protein
MGLIDQPPQCRKGSTDMHLAKQRAGKALDFGGGGQSVKSADYDS